MRKLLFIIPVLFILSCKEEVDPVDNSISDEPLSGTVDGQAWNLERSSGQYDFNNNGLGNHVETITLVLSKNDSFDYCLWPIDFEPAAYAILTMLPHLGAQQIGLNTTKTFFAFSNLSYPQTGFADLFVEELDTAGKGYVKGKIKYANRVQGSPANNVEGSFEAYLCRDIRKTDFLDQNLQGVFKSEPWELQSGRGYGPCGTNRLFFYDFQISPGDCQSADSFPQLTVEFLTSSIQTGFYSTGSSPPSINIFTQTDAFAFQLPMEGVVEILEVDIAGQLIRGQMDSYNGVFQFEFNGKFEIPFYQ